MECPAHELPLVTFEALPRDLSDESELPGHDQSVSIFDPRFGRGFVMVGVVASLVGFSMPVFSILSGEQTRVFSGFEAASSRAPNLWTVPFVALMFAWILMRRRTPLAMLGARLAGVVFALAPLFSLIYTVFKVREGAAEWAQRAQRAMVIDVEYGVLVIAVGVFCLLWGSIRFGVLPMPRGAPSNPEPHRKPQAGARG